MSLLRALLGVLLRHLPKVLSEIDANDLGKTEKEKRDERSLEARARAHIRGTPSGRGKL